MGGGSRAAVQGREPAFLESNKRSKTGNSDGHEKKGVNVRGGAETRPDWSLDLEGSTAFSGLPFCLCSTLTPVCCILICILDL